MINDHKTRREWKIQLQCESILFLLKIPKKLLEKEIMMGNETDEISKKLPDSLLQNYLKS